MQPPKPSVAIDAPVSESRDRWSRLPSWLGSVVFHLALFVTLGLTIQMTPHGAMPEQGRETGIALKPRADSSQYLTEDDASGPGTDNKTVNADGASNVIGQSTLPQNSPLDPGRDLPKALNVLGPGAKSGGAGGGLTADAFTQGSGGTRSVEGGKGYTRVFGVPGEGNRFVYVFDRSGSMGGSGRSPLAVAKAELLKSLQSLEKTHQFQIIFYNDAPSIFELNDRTPGLVFANDRSRTQARQFVDGITAAGGTRHEEALLKALYLRPDVIFFLTDADQPVLLPAQIDRITKRNGGTTSINCIEFGLGQQTGEDNFLKQLARLNGGKYGYVDISGSR